MAFQGQGDAALVENRDVAQRLPVEKSRKKASGWKTFLDWSGDLGLDLGDIWKIWSHIAKPHQGLKPFSSFSGSFIIGMEGCRVIETYHVKVRKKPEAVFFRHRITLGAW